MSTIPELRKDFCKSIVGRKLTDVEALAAASTMHWEIRVTKEDGEDYLVSKGFVARRIDVEVESGIVVGAR